MTSRANITKSRRVAEDRTRNVEAAHERLGHLYEISKVLTRFHGAERTVSEVLAIVTQAIPVRTGMLLLESRHAQTRPRAMVWHEETVGALEVRAMKAQARAAYAPLRRGSDAFDAEEETGISVLPSASASLTQEPPAPPFEPGRMILLPLVVARGHVFGALALQSVEPLAEPDLAFINVVVNQLAITLDREAISEALQAEANNGKRDAERRELEAQALRQQAEEATALATERMEFNRAVADGLGEGVIAVDVMGQITFFNRAAAQLLRVAEAAALGSVVQQVIRIERADGTAVSGDDDPFRLVIHGGFPVRNEEQLLSRQGQRPFPVSYSSAPLRRRGQISGAVLVFRDISERKEAEEAEREAAALFRLLAESVPDKIFLTKANGEIDYLNQRWIEFTGLSFEEVRDPDWTRLMHPDDVAPTMSRWRHALATGEPAQFEHRFRRADGVYRWHLGRAEAVRDAEGKVSMWIGSNTDIDDQKAAEAEQRLLADVSTRLLAAPAHGNSVRDIARAAVPALADLCLLDEIETNGEARQVEVVFADEDKQHALAALAKAFVVHPGGPTAQARALASGTPLLLADIGDAELAGIAHDDEAARFLRAVGVKSMMVVPLAARGRKLGVLTFVMAESDRRYTAIELRRAQDIAHLAALAIDNARLFEQARRATRARDDLLAVVAHDLRNPLGAITMVATQALAMPADADRRKSGRKGLEMVKRAADRMNRLIGDLVDVGRIESGHLALEVQRVCVGSLVQEVVELYRRSADEKALHLKSFAPCEPLEISGDRDRIVQVFGNLVGNAVKFTEAGTITIRAERRAEELVCSVQDSGPGIPESEIPHLFDRYWQATKTARLGTGLGLSIAQSLVQAHGGRVWAESVVGSGSTFFFALPLADSPRSLATALTHARP